MPLLSQFGHGHLPYSYVKYTKQTNGLVESIPPHRADMSLQDQKRHVDREVVICFYL